MNKILIFSIAVAGTACATLAGLSGLDASHSDESLVAAAAPAEWLPPPDVAGGAKAQVENPEPPATLDPAATRPGPAPAVRTPWPKVEAPPTPETVRLEGRTVDENGEPVAGAEVYLRNAALPVSVCVMGDGPLGSCFADGRGRFSMACKPSKVGKGILVGRHPGRACDLLLVTGLVAGGVIRDLTLRVSSGGTIRGWVTDVRGWPAAGIRLRFVYRSDTTLHAGWPADAHLCAELAPFELASGTDGSFASPVLRKGAWLVAPMGDREYALAYSVQVVVSDGEASELRFRIGGELAIEGIVVDAKGNPQAGAEIQAADANGLAIATAGTREDGTFRFEGLPPGDFTLRASKKGNLSGQIRGAAGSTGLKIVLQATPTRL